MNNLIEWIANLDPMVILIIGMWGFMILVYIGLFKMIKIILEERKNEKKIGKVERLK